MSEQTAGLEAADHDHHEMPTEGSALTGVAVSATLHCLTGCAIGEVAGMAIGTALGFSNLGTIALAVALAFLFGYTLTSLPLLRAGLALSAVIPIALASDTISIATMEVVDNLIMLTVPGAMEAHLSDLLFWGALSFALAVAFVLTVPVNRWLIARGKGHTAVHETGIHGGPPPRVVGTVLAVAAIFGTTVLIAEGITNEDMGHGGGHEAAAPAEAGGEHGGHAESGATAGEGSLGLTAEDRGLTLELDRAELPRDRRATLGFRIVSEDGSPVTDYEVEHERELHLIVVRSDLTGFQHLHPTRDDDGRWSTPITLPEAGTYRVYADFNHDGGDYTLGSNLTVEGETEIRGLPAPSEVARTDSGYRVALDGEAHAGEASELTFEVTRGGEPVDVDPYLGADGHLVALRESDLAYLHTHPEGSATGDGIRFAADFPSEGAYRLFLQFKHRGEVRTAEFTVDVPG